MLTCLHRIMTGSALALTMTLAPSTYGSIVVLHTWNLEGSAGSPAGASGVDATGGIHLNKVGTFNHAATGHAGGGVDFANVGHNLSLLANNYYENTTGAVTVASSQNWGMEAWVKLNAIPSTAGDAHGETAVIEVGSAAGGTVILQTFNSVLGGGGTPNWMIHLPGHALLSADPAAGGALVAGKEQHLAAVFHAGGWHLYVDGVEVPLIAMAGHPAIAITPGTGVRLGAADFNGVKRGLDGVVGVARIFEFNAGEFSIQDTLVNVPEPASLMLMGSAAALLLAGRRR